jgi:pimeloyl-ACP methyl ester carboxylesterase
MPQAISKDGQARTHRAISQDGTEIVARVHGQGPPIVLLPAGPGDSELSWRHVVPFLSEQGTCYLLETRGRGLSGDNPDHSPDRLVEDVLAFVESLGEPVGLVGWGSALWARVAAREDAPVFGVAAYEPGAGEVMSKESGKRMGEVFAGVGELVAEGRLVDAAHTFIEGSEVIYSEEDLATGAPAEFWEAAAERLPLFLQESKQAAGSGKPGATSPQELGKITVPALVLHGDRSSRWFTDSVQHVAEHLPDVTVRQIPGAAHFGPYTHGRAVADEMALFFGQIYAFGRASAEAGD